MCLCEDFYIDNRISKSYIIVSRVHIKYLLNINKWLVNVLDFEDNFEIDIFEFFKNKHLMWVLVTSKS
jgi:hypothetical protein